jgi:hypothetical protein
MAKAGTDVFSCPGSDSERRVKGKNRWVKRGKGEKGLSAVISPFPISPI